MQVGKSHGVHLGGGTPDATEVNLVKRKGCVGYHVGAEAEVASCSRGRLDRVVRTNAYDDKGGLATGVKPALQPSINEGIRDVFLNDMLTLKRGQGRLELNSGLTGQKR